MEVDEEIHKQAPNLALGMQSKKGRRGYMIKGGQYYDGESTRQMNQAH